MDGSNMDAAAGAEVQAATAAAAEASAADAAPGPAANTHFGFKHKLFRRARAVFKLDRVTQTVSFHPATRRCCRLYRHESDSEDLRYRIEFGRWI